MKSIRRYLQIRLVRGTTFILVAGTVVLGAVIRNLDVREFDEALESKARVLATLALREGRVLEVNFAGEYMPEFETAEHTEYFQFRFIDGAVIERSDMLGEADLPFYPNRLQEPVFSDLVLPDGRRGRLAQIALSPRVADEGTIVGDETRIQIPEPLDPTGASMVLTLARSREGLNGLLFTVYLVLAGIDLFVLLLMAGLVRASLKVGFQPVETMNAQIAGFGPNTLHSLIHLDEAPAELQTMLATLNGLIERLADAFARERRFTSDVAHELRTPVAELRAAAEVGAKWADDPELVQRRFTNLQDSAISMERLVNSLLELSRLDRGIVPVVNSDVRVAELVERCWGNLAPLMAAREQDKEQQLDPELVAHTDPVMLEMILQNLLGNAASHGPTHSTLSCLGHAQPDGTLSLTVSNPAPDLHPGDLPHLYDRFWRKNASRTEGLHSGLGLSIVKSLAEVLGIRLRTRLSPDQVLSVTLTLPAASAPP